VLEIKIEQCAETEGKWGEGLFRPGRAGKTSLMTLE